MAEDTQISEFDVFNFVFFNDRISREKNNMILESKRLVPLVEFYTQLKNSLDKQITTEQKLKIAQKISAYKLDNTIQLFPVSEEASGEKSGMISLAAASGEAESDIKTQTFIDSEKGYVIRIVRIIEVAKIYIFPIDDSRKNKFRLTIKPSNKTYEIDNIDSPLEIVNLPKVDSITIDFI